MQFIRLNPPKKRKKNEQVHVMEKKEHLTLNIKMDRKKKSSLREEP
jgi:hypothetical protein